jgi:hypothetical protein
VGLIRGAADRVDHGIDVVTLPTEQLIRGAGYDPVNLGGIEQAREDGLGPLFAANRAGLGTFLYRWARPGEL